MQIDVDSLFTLLIIGATLLSFASSIGRSASESRRKAREQAERQREARERGQDERERDPARQSYQGYLERTRQPDAARPGPAAAPALSDEQERLRRETARKMGRTLADDLARAPERAPTGPQPAPRTLAGDTRASLPGPPPAPRPAQVFPVPASLEARTLEGGSIEVRGPQQPAFPAARAGRLVPESTGGMAGGQTVDAWTRRERTSEVRRPGPLDTTVGRSTGPIDTRDMVRAIVLAEILGPPVSRRRRAPRAPF